MSLAPVTTRNAAGDPFQILFEDNGDPDGPKTPASVIVGDALTALQDIATNTTGVQTVAFDEPQAITGTVDFVPTEPLPITASGNLPVVDGTAAWTRLTDATLSESVTAAAGTYDVQSWVRTTDGLSQWSAVETVTVS